MGSMKALLGLLLVVIAAYVAFQFIPPYFNNYQFRDDIQTIAKFAPANPKSSEEEIRNEVLKKAQSYGLPVTMEQIRVAKDGSSVSINVDYTVVVNLMGGKQVPITFHASNK